MFFSKSGGIHSRQIINPIKALLVPNTTKNELKDRSYANIKTLIKLMEINSDPPSRALVLGVYADEHNRNDTGILTKLGWNYSKYRTNHMLYELLKSSGQMPRCGEARIFFNVEGVELPYYSAVAIVGLGTECLGFCSYELIDEHKEAIRRSIAKGCIKLQQLHTDRIEVESCGDAEAAAEGAALGVWAYQELRNPRNRIDIPSIDLYTTKDDPCDVKSWKIGLQKAGAQNLTRQLQETPANILTPTAFAQNVVEILCKSGVNVEVKVEGWAKTQGMNGFLAVGRASCEAPIFLELSYYGTCTDERPIVLIGQGITYDSGGVCKKNDSDLEYQRGDMTGAACVVACMRTIAGMRLPINIRGLVPLCENAAGCNAYKAGDTIRCMNGKTIQIDRPDFEDTMLLADALLYAQNFCPKFIVDIGTTSSRLSHVLDEAASGIFTNSELLWRQIVNASIHTGDRVWRFPLWDYYSTYIKGTKNTHSDLENYGTKSRGQPCAAAALLREFVPCGQWIHIDAASVMLTNGKDFDYIRKGMAGRPTRTLIEFLSQTICTENQPSK